MILTTYVTESLDPSFAVAFWPSYSSFTKGPHSPTFILFMQMSTVAILEIGVCVWCPPRNLAKCFFSFYERISISTALSVGWWKNRNLKSVSKKVVVANSRHYIGVFLEILRKTTIVPVRMAGSPGKFRSRQLPNKNIRYSSHTSLLGWTKN
jgi:hypothetical protein